MPSDRKPSPTKLRIAESLATLGLLWLMGIAFYVVLYFATVEGPDEGGGGARHAVFKPLEWIDRRIRPQWWE